MNKALTSLAVLAGTTAALSPKFDYSTGKRIEESYSFESSGEYGKGDFQTIYSKKNRKKLSKEFNCTPKKKAKVLGYKKKDFKYVPRVVYK